MSQREPRHHYAWHSFNPVYGPWYRLKDNGKEISGGEAVVMPDLDKGRWFWTVRVGSRKAPRLVRSGHEPDLEGAKFMARQVFDEEY